MSCLHPSAVLRTEPADPRRRQFTLALHGLRPDQLGFEISERAVVDDRVLETANALHRRGVRIAWDDVGTGASSMSQLRDWPLDILKLDGSLVLSAIERDEDAQLIRLVCSVAHELGTQVLAEHVASAQIRETVQRLGCDLGQGDHLGRPVPAGDLSLPRPAREVASQPQGAQGAQGAGAAALPPSLGLPDQEALDRAISR